MAPSAPAESADFLTPAAIFVITLLAVISAGAYLRSGAKKSESERETKEDSPGEEQPKADLSRSVMSAAPEEALAAPQTAKSAVEVKEEDAEAVEALQNGAQKRKSLAHLPLGMRLDEAFLPHLRHDAMTKYRQNYQRFREGNPFGARGETAALATVVLPDDEADGDDFGRPAPRITNNAPALSNLPTLFAVERHLLSGDTGKMANRPEIIEELQHRINDFRMSYRLYRQGSPHGAQGELGYLKKLMAAAPVDLLPAANLASMIKQAKKLDERTRHRRTQSEENLRDAAGAPGLHVHFGAGRLGLGLVMPAVRASKCPFAIVNPVFPEFDPLLEKHRARRERGEGGQLLLLELNGETYAQLLIVTDEDDMDALDEFLAAVDDWENAPPRPGVLLLSSEQVMTEKLLRKAKTFSTSVGPGIPSATKMLLSILPDRSEEEGKVLLPGLFACENDHDAVEKMYEELKGTVAVASCLVDRICTSRDVYDTLPKQEGYPRADQDPSLISVNTEPWTGLLMVPPFEDGVYANGAPFEGDHIMRPKLPAEANYISRRKLVTVNGMHTTLAFMTLAKHSQTDDDYMLQLKNDKLVDPEGSLRLLTVEPADENEEKSIWAWAVARQLLLMYEIGTDVMMMAHDIDTSLPQEEQEAKLCEVVWDYARTCVLRFDSTNDECGRVLGGGVVNRLRTRLRPVGEFLSANPNLRQTLGSIPKQLFKVSGVSSAFMYGAVAGLTATAEQLVEGAQKSK